MANDRTPALARTNVQKTSARPVSSARRAPWRISRLASSPLSSLLPTLGSVRTLQLSAEALQRRYLQVTRGSHADDLSDRELAAEDAMLSQVMQWLALAPPIDELHTESEPVDYSPAELAAIYELGRLYFEMGYFGAAERIWVGLSSLEPVMALPAIFGIACIRIERDQAAEAVPLLRKCLEAQFLTLQIKLALCSAFLATKEHGRSKSLLVEIGRDLDRDLSAPAEFRALWETLTLSTPT